MKHSLMLELNSILFFYCKIYNKMVYASGSVYFAYLIAYVFLPGSDLAEIIHLSFGIMVDSLSIIALVILGFSRWTLK